MEQPVFFVGRLALRGGSACGRRWPLDGCVRRALPPMMAGRPCLLSCPEQETRSAGAKGKGRTPLWGALNNPHAWEPLPRGRGPVPVAQSCALPCRSRPWFRCPALGRFAAMRQQATGLPLPSAPPFGRCHQTCVASNGGDFDFPPLGPLDSLSPLETTRGSPWTPKGRTWVLFHWLWAKGLGYVTPYSFSPRRHLTTVARGNTVDATGAVPSLPRLARLCLATQPPC